MTETPSQPQASPPATGGRGLKIALAVSVALNLAVAGLAAGAWIRGGPDKGLPRDLSFGPFSAALTDADRRALRRGLMEHVGELREGRAAARAEFAALIDSLRAEPFDPAAMQTALAAIETRNARRIELGLDLIGARLAEMTDAERQAFADRLEKGLKRFGRN